MLVLRLPRVRNFYPRSPCGERLSFTSISSPPILFLSTLSLRRATLELFLYYQDNRISIHALLAESDSKRLCDALKHLHFYPRSPCGERRRGARESIGTLHFYPRSPCGERRDVIAVMTDAQSISIHALLAESDTLRQLQSALCRNFYPRSPCGERLMYALIFAGPVLFLSTLSLRRATALSLPFGAVWIISIHALLAESDSASYNAYLEEIISIHALLAESDRRGAVPVILII